MFNSTVVSGVAAFQSETELNKGLKVLLEAGVITRSDDEYIWEGGITDSEDNVVMMEDNMLFFPSLDQAEPLVETLMAVLDYSTNNDVKIARLDESISILHIVDGETVVDIDDYDELLEHFEIFSEEFMDDEISIGQELYDRVVAWLDELDEEA